MDISKEGKFFFIFLLFPPILLTKEKIFKKFHFLIQPLFLFFRPNLQNTKGGRGDRKR